jgi:hypothetical protein
MSHMSYLAYSMTTPYYDLRHIDPVRPCSAGVGLSGLVRLTTPGLGETTCVTQSPQNHSILIPIILSLYNSIW